MQQAKSNNQLSLFMAAFFALFLLTAQMAAQTQITAFTYQGRLNDGGAAANADYDMQFKLFDAATGGAQQGATFTNTAVHVTGGIFSLELDFGAAAFNGEARFLEICVRPAGSPNSYTVLAPRQSISATPYAVRSLDAGTSDALSADCVGCVTSDQVQSLDGAKITGTVAGSQISGTIPAASVPSGSGNYIQNSVAALPAGQPQGVQEGSFDITGDGKIGGNLVVNGGVGIGISNPTAGQLYVLNNNLGSPAIYGESATSRGVWGKSVSSRGVYGESSSNVGVFGISATGAGVYGESAAGVLTSPGVLGRATGVNGTAVYALSTGSGGVGVYGESLTGRGVWGKAVASRGVYGEANTGEGVYGRSNTGAGVFGISATGPGVYGESAAVSVLTSPGVFGRSTGVNGTAVYALSTGSGGIGVYAESASGRALWGKSVGSRGVYGESLNGIGVEGVSSSSGSFGGYFRNTAGGTALRVEGKGSVGVLEITGGSDLAENFAIEAEAKPGMVVAIDPQNAGRLAISHGAYNRRVAGVISGANNLPAGMVLPDLVEGQTAQPVALSGRVWVYCDAAKRPIKPGDLLTTSNTPGHAMKVVNHARAQGAIIGKAMTALPAGRGLVLVLVTLQ